MLIQSINTDTAKTPNISLRPVSFDEFIGQSTIKNILTTAIQSALQESHTLWHILLNGPSGYGKTTLAWIIAGSTQTTLYTITAYAISKPADMIGILNQLQEWDVLFVDEIHRLKPALEEMLYIAMEDYRIDMVLPDWWSVSLPLKPFTLIWATTKPEWLSSPLKNRFVYGFHLEPYSHWEKVQILQRYLEKYYISIGDDMLERLAQYTTHTPREITTMTIQIRDYLTVHSKKWANGLMFDSHHIDGYLQYSQRKIWGLTSLHERYLAILTSSHWNPVGLKTLATKLWMTQKSVEDEIEPLLFGLSKIEKTMRWRILV